MKAISQRCEQVRWYYNVPLLQSKRKSRISATRHRDQAVPNMLFIAPNAPVVSNSPVALEWAKALGSPVAVAIAALCLTFFFNRWQVRLAKEKLRHDLYDRRFAIYRVFRELLLALHANGVNEIKAELRKANIARLEAAFLLSDDPGIHEYLDQLCEQVNDEVLVNMALCDIMKNDSDMMNPEVRKEFGERQLRLNSARRDILDRHFKELPQQFARFLKLTDFSDSTADFHGAQAETCASPKSSGIRRGATRLLIAGCPTHPRFSDEWDLQRPFLAVDPHLSFFTAGISSETAHSQSSRLATRPHFNNCR
jgi:hypothetical protein